jgi:hypothetical protein
MAGGWFRGRGGGVMVAELGEKAAMAAAGDERKEATAGMLGLCQSSVAMVGAVGAREEQGHRRRGGRRGTA